MNTKVIAYKETTTLSHTQRSGPTAKSAIQTGLLFLQLFQSLILPLLTTRKTNTDKIPYNQAGFSWPWASKAELPSNLKYFGFSPVPDDQGRSSYRDVRPESPSIFLQNDVPPEQLRPRELKYGVDFTNFGTYALAAWELWQSKITVSESAAYQLEKATKSNNLELIRRTIYSLEDPSLFGQNNITGAHQDADFLSPWAVDLKTGQNKINNIDTNQPATDAEIISVFNLLLAYENPDLDNITRQKAFDLAQKKAPQIWINLVAGKRQEQGPTASRTLLTLKTNPSREGTVVNLSYYSLTAFPKFEKYFQGQHTSYGETQDWSKLRRDAFELIIAAFKTFKNEHQIPKEITYRIDGTTILIEKAITPKDQDPNAPDSDRIPFILAQALEEIASNFDEQRDAPLLEASLLCMTYYLPNKNLEQLAVDHTGRARVAYNTAFVKAFKGALNNQSVNSWVRAYQPIVLNDKELSHTEKAYSEIFPIAMSKVKYYWDKIAFQRVTAQITANPSGALNVEMIDAPTTQYHPTSTLNPADNLGKAALKVATWKDDETKKMGQATDAEQDESLVSDASSQGEYALARGIAIKALQNLDFSEVLKESTRGWTEETQTINNSIQYQKSPQIISLLTMIQGLNTSLTSQGSLPSDKVQTWNRVIDKTDINNKFIFDLNSYIKSINSKNDFFQTVTWWNTIPKLFEFLQNKSSKSNYDLLESRYLKYIQLQTLNMPETGNKISSKFKNIVTEAKQKNHPLSWISDQFSKKIGDANNNHNNILLYIELAKAHIENKDLSSAAESLSTIYQLYAQTFRSQIADDHQQQKLERNHPYEVDNLAPNRFMDIWVNRPLSNSVLEAISRVTSNYMSQLNPDSGAANAAIEDAMNAVGVTPRTRAGYTAGLSSEQRNFYGEYHQFLSTIRKTIDPKKFSPSELYYQHAQTLFQLATQTNTIESYNNALKEIDRAINSQQETSVLLKNPSRIFEYIMTKGQIYQAIVRLYSNQVEDLNRDPIKQNRARRQLITYQSKLQELRKTIRSGMDLAITSKIPQNPLSTSLDVYIAKHLSRLGKAESVVAIAKCLQDEIGDANAVRDYPRAIQLTLNSLDYLERALEDQWYSFEVMSMLINLVTNLSQFYVLQADRMPNRNYNDSVARVANVEMGVRLLGLVGNGYLHVFELTFTSNHMLEQNKSLKESFNKIKRMLQKEREGATRIEDVIGLSPETHIPVTRTASAISSYGPTRIAATHIQKPLTIKESELDSPYKTIFYSYLVGTGIISPSGVLIASDVTRKPLTIQSIPAAHLAKHNRQLNTIIIHNASKGVFSSTVTSTTTYQSPEVFTKSYPLLLSYRAAVARILGDIREMNQNPYSTHYILAAKFNLNHAVNELLKEVYHRDYYSSSKSNKILSIEATKIEFQILINHLGEANINEDNIDQAIVVLNKFSEQLNPEEQNALNSLIIIQAYLDKTNGSLNIQRALKAIDQVSQNILKHNPRAKLNSSSLESFLMLLSLTRETVSAMEQNAPQASLTKFRQLLVDMLSFNANEQKIADLKDLPNPALRNILHIIYENRAIILDSRAVSDALGGEIQTKIPL